MDMVCCAAGRIHFAGVLGETRDRVAVRVVNLQKSIVGSMPFTGWSFRLQERTETSVLHSTGAVLGSECSQERKASMKKLATKMAGRRLIR